MIYKRAAAVLGSVLCGAGGQLVQLVDHLDEVVQLPLGQGEGQMRAVCKRLEK